MTAAGRFVEGVMAIASIPLAFKLIALVFAAGGSWLDWRPFSADEMPYSVAFVMILLSFAAAIITVAAAAISFAVCWSGDRTAVARFLLDNGPAEVAQLMPVGLEIAGFVPPVAVCIACYPLLTGFEFWALMLALCTTVNGLNVWTAAHAMHGMTRSAPRAA